MGYRFNIGAIPKKEYSKLKKCKTKKELAIATNTLNDFEEADNYLFSGVWLSKYEIDEVWDMAWKLNKKKTFNRFFVCKELI